MKTAKKFIIIKITKDNEERVVIREIDIDSPLINNCTILFDTYDEATEDVKKNLEPQGYELKTKLGV